MTEKYEIYLISSVYDGPIVKHDTIKLCSIWYDCVRKQMRRVT
jgi:hypothetical protein